MRNFAEMNLESSPFLRLLEAENCKVWQKFRLKRGISWRRRMRIKSRGNLWSCCCCCITYFEPPTFDETTSRGILPNNKRQTKQRTKHNPVGIEIESFSFGGKTKEETLQELDQILAQVLACFIFTLACCTFQARLRDDILCSVVRELAIYLAIHHLSSELFFREKRETKFKWNWTRDKIINSRLTES